MKKILTLSHAHHTGKKDQLFSSADLIFCATGNYSLKKDDLAFLKRDSYVFMATSADDEIENYFSLIKDTIPYGLHRKLIQIERGSSRFFLCNNGNTVNFAHGGIVGPFINLVQAELLFALSQFSNASKNNIFELPDASKNFIAQKWLEHFSLY